MICDILELWVQSVRVVGEIFLGAGFRLVEEVCSYLSGELRFIEIDNKKFVYLGDFSY